MRNEDQRNREWQRMAKIHCSYTASEWLVYSIVQILVYFNLCRSTGFTDIKQHFITKGSCNKELYMFKGPGCIRRGVRFSRKSQRVKICFKSTLIPFCKLSGTWTTEEFNRIHKNAASKQPFISTQQVECTWVLYVSAPANNNVVKWILWLRQFDDS